MSYSDIKKMYMLDVEVQLGYIGNMYRALDIRGLDDLPIHYLIPFKELVKLCINVTARDGVVSPDLELEMTVDEILIDLSDIYPVISSQLSSEDVDKFVGIIIEILEWLQRNGMYGGIVHSAENMGSVKNSTRLWILTR